MKAFKKHKKSHLKNSYREFKDPAEYIWGASDPRWRNTVQQRNRNDKDTIHPSTCTHTSTDSHSKPYNNLESNLKRGVHDPGAVELIVEKHNKSI